jgi:hypothetical protein
MKKRLLGNGACGDQAITLVLLLFGALLLASCRASGQDPAAAEYYHVRHQLRLINPYEMIGWLSAPAVILWSILRRRDLRHYLLLGGIYVVVAHPLLVAGVLLFGDLVAQWQAGAGSQPAVLAEMLTGDGVKMVLAVVMGWLCVLGQYLLWLLLFSPAVYLLDRRRRQSPRPASGGPRRDRRPVLAGVRAVAGGASDVFLVMGVIAVLGAGPCYWVSRQPDAPPPAPSMLPRFFVVGAAFLAIGVLVTGIERVVTKTLPAGMAGR